MTDYPLMSENMVIIKEGRRMDEKMEIQAAYIRVFGAAAAALEELAALGEQVRVPEVVKAKEILIQAIADTEEHTELAAPEP